MLSAFLRLFAIRPILAGSLLGIPILTLILLGLATALLLKLLLFVVIPIAVVVLIVKRIRRTHAGRADPHRVTRPRWSV